MENNFAEDGIMVKFLFKIKASEKIFRPKALQMQTIYGRFGNLLL